MEEETPPEAYSDLESLWVPPDFSERLRQSLASQPTRVGFRSSGARIAMPLTIRKPRQKPSEGQEVFTVRPGKAHQFDLMLCEVKPQDGFGRVRYHLVNEHCDTTGLLSMMMAAYRVHMATTRGGEAFLFPEPLAGRWKPGGLCHWEQALVEALHEAQKGWIDIYAHTRPISRFHGGNEGYDIIAYADLPYPPIWPDATITAMLHDVIKTTGTIIDIAMPSGRVTYAPPEERA
jgi:hypothetical protein